jgi:hypothetical protein
LARPNREIGDLRGDVDEAFVSIEVEIDILAATIAPPVGKRTVTAVQSGAVVAADVGQTVRCDSSSNPQTVQLPAVTVGNSGQPVEVKVVIGASPGSPLVNNVTIVPNGADTIDGAANFLISTQRASVTLRSDGESGWMLV